MTRLIRVLTLVLASSLVAAACSDDAVETIDSDDSPTTAESVTVTLIAHDSFAVEAALLEAFSIETGITVEVVNAGDTGQMISQSGIDLDEISHFDIYSCFPSAVQIACNEIGLPHLDERGVTVTGGLPFFGGPGNNYSLHAIAEMVETLRKGGSGHGLVTANGMYLTKHSLGIYSTEPPENSWREIDSSPLQKEIDSAPRLSIASSPAGKATIESYTVSFGREGPKKGIVIARNPAGERIVANTGVDENILDQLLVQDPIGCSGNIHVQDGVNILEL